MTATGGTVAVDVLLASAIAATLLSLAVSAIHVSRDRRAARQAAQVVAGTLQRARLEALKRNTHVAIRFGPADRQSFRAYLDGDGDGVLQRDIDAGVDPPSSAEVRMPHLIDGVAFRVLSDVPDLGGQGTIMAGTDPVRLGGSNLLSFSPLGGSTSGTLYLSSATGPQFCVRILGATGRIRVLWFDSWRRTWRDR
ncbi:MAG: GspH/FimT family pseudopilin [Acidobacteriota bacterium]